MGRDPTEKDDAIDAIALPLAEEQVDITTREVVTGRVRISTTTDTIDEVVRQELQGTRGEVARIPVGRILGPEETAPSPRTEGSTTIVPIFEEILVIEKRLLLKEELHIEQHTTRENVEIPISVRKQRAVIERLEPDQSPEDN